MKKGLLLLNLVLSFMGVGQVWQVQLSAYPLWAYVGTNELHNYHIAWWHSIWIPLFIPAGLAMICTIGLFWFRPPAVLRSSVWTAIIILLITWTNIYLVGTLNGVNWSNASRISRCFQLGTTLKKTGTTDQNAETII